MITRGRAFELRELIEQATMSLSDEDALQGVELFPAWRADFAYKLNSRVKHNKILYKCVQAHTSQSDWAPDVTPALWTVVSLEKWPEWVQPTGAQDAYMKGDKVSHNEKHWVSTINNNVWEPGGVGTEALWQEV